MNSYEVTYVSISGNYASKIYVTASSAAAAREIVEQQSFCVRVTDVSAPKPVWRIPDHPDGSYDPR